MKLETIKKDKKKKVIIGSMIVLSVVGCFSLTTTRAKYRSVQSIKLANGTVRYTASDLQIVAIKISEDGTNYIDATQVPAENYTLNSSSKCTINGTDDTSITIMYDSGIVSFSSLKKGAKCNLYFDKESTSEDTLAKLNITNIKEGIPTFGTIAAGSETDVNNGIYRMLDPMYGSGKYTYYWRGNATTNHVIFDNKCWRIVRINGDGSIRLIYNGTPSGNTCTQGANNAAVIRGSSNAEKYYATSTGVTDKSYYVGWTYGTGQRTLSGTDSNAKTQTEKWYSNNISAAAKLKVDSNGKFCNDRNVGTPPSAFYFGSTYTTTWNTNTGDSNRFAYKASERIYGNSPTLACDLGDTYTLSVGAITADEVMLAGGRPENNTSYYLNTGVSYWTMSPRTWNGACVFYVNSLGYLDGTGVQGTYGLRPVINLTSDTLFAVGGDGTSNSPYIVQ